MRAETETKRRSQKICLLDAADNIGSVLADPAVSYFSQKSAVIVFLMAFSDSRWPSHM
jgi:hypothetical protein